MPRRQMIRNGLLRKSLVPLVSIAVMATLGAVCLALSSSARGEAQQTKPNSTLGDFRASVDGLAFSADGKLLISAGAAGTGNLYGPGLLIFWDVSNGTAVRELQNDLPIWAFQMSADGQLAATGAINGQVKLWDMVKKEFNCELRGHKAQITCLSFSASGKILVSLSDMEPALQAGGWQRTVVKVWDVPGSKERTSFEIPRKTKYLGPARANLSPDGKLLAWSAGDNSPIRYFDAATGKDLTHPTGGGLLFAPDGKTVFGGRCDPAMTVEDWIADAGFPGFSIVGWDFFTGKEKLVLKSPNHGWEAMCLSADGKWLAAGGQGGAAKLGGRKGLGATATVWNLTTGKEQAHVLVDKFAFGCRSVALSPDGKILATSPGSSRYGNCTVKLWDTQTGKDITLGVRREPPVEDPGGTRLSPKCFLDKLSPEA